MAKRKRETSGEDAGEVAKRPFRGKKRKALRDEEVASQNSSIDPQVLKAQKRAKRREQKKLARRARLAQQELAAEALSNVATTQLPAPPPKQWVNGTQSAPIDKQSGPPVKATGKTASVETGQQKVIATQAEENSKSQDAPQTPQKKKRKPRKPKAPRTEGANDSQEATPKTRPTQPAVKSKAPEAKAKVGVKAANVPNFAAIKNPETALQRFSEYLGDDSSDDESSVGGFKTTEVKAKALPAVAKTPGKKIQATDAQKDTKPPLFDRKVVEISNHVANELERINAPEDKLQREEKVDNSAEEGVPDEPQSTPRTTSSWSILRPSTWFSKRKKPVSAKHEELQHLTDETSNIHLLRSGRKVGQPGSPISESPQTPMPSKIEADTQQTPISCGDSRKLRSQRLTAETTPTTTAERTPRLVAKQSDGAGKSTTPKPNSTRSLRSWRSFDNNSPVKEDTTPKPPKRTPTRRTSTKSEYFLPLDRVDLPTPNRRRAPAGVSTAPIPPISAERFGIIQEKLWHEPFWMLVAVILLNKTTGRAAIPTFWKIREKYPDAAALKEADQQELADMIYYCGLFNQRSKSLIKLATVWDERPPVTGVRWRTLHYPCQGDGKEFGAKDAVEGDGDGCVGALEMAHLPGCGRYAYDSWRIFCRDVLRGVAEDFNGKGAGEGFEAEWKRVLPEDKELRATVRWMWLREGWIWNHEDGTKRRATEEEMERAVKGEMDVPDKDELKFAAIAVNTSGTGKPLPAE